MKTNPWQMEQPWLYIKKWQHNQIKSSALLVLVIYWVFSALWMGISFAITPEIIDQYQSGEKQALIFLVFPITGIFLVFGSIRKLRTWQKIGRSPLVLSPFPGSIGGQVGGHIELNMGFDSLTQCELSLECIRRKVTRSGGESKTENQVQWQVEGFGFPKQSATGKTLIEFCFDVPSHLSATQEPDRNYIYWQLTIRCNHPKLKFTRQFEIPVFETGQQKSVIDKNSSRHPSQDLKNRQRIIQSFIFSETQNGFELYHPMLRNKALGFVLMLFGGIFSAAGVAFWLSEDSVLPLVAFTGAGTLVVLWGVYLLFNSLTVRIRPDGISLIRRFLFFRVSSKNESRENISHLQLAKSYSSTSGYSHRLNFNVKAMLKNGKAITVAEHLQGEGTAQTAMETLSAKSGIPAK